MTTYTLHGFRTDYDLADNVTGVTAVTLDVVLGANTDGTFSYSIVAPVPGDLPDVEITASDDVNALIDGSPIDDTMWEQIGQVEWNGNTTYILAFTYDAPPGVASKDWYFELGGTALPDMAGAVDPVAAWEAFEATVTSAGPVTTGAFAPGVPISFAGLPNMTSTENDVMNGTDADDVLNGGLGKDVINGLNGNDDLSGGAGNDTLRGGNGNDTLNGGNGKDKLFGGNGADELVASKGNDVLNAGGGTDTLTFDVSGVDNVVVDLQAGTATSTWGASSFSHTVSGVEILIGSSGDDDLIGMNGQNNRIEGRAGNDIMDGGDGKDTLSGQAGDDDIAAGGGNDTVLGGAGNDLLLGDNGNDSVSGGTGNDKIKGGAGSDMLNGEGGKDRLEGGSGADDLSGGAQNDILLGGGGNDTMLGGGGRDKLNGGSGDDTMTGGSGVDTFIFSSGDDTITDLSTADKIDLSGLGISDFAELRDIYTSEVGGNTVIDDGAGNTLTLTGVAEINLEDYTFLF